MATSPSMTPWSSFTQADYSIEQWKRACLLDRGTGDPNTKERYGVPVREPSGALNRGGMAQAAGRLNQVEGVSAEKVTEVARALVRLYTECDMSAPDHLREMAGESTTGQQRAAYPAAEVIERAASVHAVNYPERIIDIIAVPYDQPTQVEYRGELWTEVFCRSAFNGFDPNAPRARTVPVSAVLKAPAYSHEGAHLVGRVIDANPNHPEGLMLSTKISETPAGDEMLALTGDRALFPSVGYVSRGPDTQANRRTMTRKIQRAFLDHLTYVPTAAYDGAAVLAMRSASAPADPIETPLLDQFLSDPVLNWADDRIERRGR